MDNPTQQSKLGKLKGSEDFKHFIWRRHDDRGAFSGHRPELMATDGVRLRRLVSHAQHIGFQQFDDPAAATDVVNRIEENIGKAVAMLGYSMFDDHNCISILHTGQGLEPGWMAFPYDPVGDGYPTLPMRAADHPTLRVVGGGSWHEEPEGPVIRAAIEQRGQRFLGSPAAFNILDHIGGWKLVAQHGQGDDAKTVRLVDAKAPILRKRAEEFRMTARFMVDPIVMREFRGDPDLSLFFEITLDAELMCLPEDWLRYWFRVEIA